MTDFLFAAAVVAAFFILGVAFGGLAVIATSALRKGAERADHGRAGHERADTGHDAGWTGTGWGGGWTDTIGAGWEEPPEADDDEDSSPPHWPGRR